MRDHRIDFFRGVAVLAIAVNHIKTSSPSMAQVPHYQFGQIFSFNFADVFIFFSGLVCGIVYGQTFGSRGAYKTLLRTLDRIKQIWIWQAFCTIAAFSIILVFERMLDVESPTHGLQDDRFFSSFWGSLLLFDPMSFLDILPLYIFYLAILPFALIAFTSYPLLTLLASGAVWLLLWGLKFLSQIGYMHPMLDQPTSPYFMHPLSAQFLFFLGVFVGMFREQISAMLERRRLFLLPIGACFLVFSDYLRQVNFAHFYFDQKATVGPLRIADLLALCVLVFTIVPNGKALGQNWVARCGRHSLEVFSVSIAFAFLFSLMSDLANAGRGLYALFLISTVALCMLSGACVEELKKRQVQQSAAAREK